MTSETFRQTSNTVFYTLSGNGVTKEDKMAAANSSRIKIPIVCDNMGVRWINDFEFIVEIGMKFSCRIS